jgi:hypothetical protein
MKKIDPLALLLDPDQLTPAHIGVSDNDWGREKVKEYREKFLKWKGKIIKTRHIQESVQIFDGDWEERYWVEVTVWDDAQKKGVTFQADNHSVLFKDANNHRLATLWVPTHDNESWVNYHRWYTTEYLNETSNYSATEWVRAEVRKLEDEKDSLMNPTPARGQTYKVVAGRKYAKGTTGKLFWWGTNNWGESYGLALNDERDERGKYKNVIFVARKNLEYVSTPEVDALVKELDKQIKDVQLKWDDVYRTHYMNAIKSWAHEFGYDAEVTLKRIASVMRDRGLVSTAAVLATV